MTPDIDARIVADFGLADRDEASGILQRLDGDLGGVSDRVLRCVLFLAGGELSQLVHNAGRARSDWRDVIYWAEYDEQGHQVRDFNLPFPASG